LVDVAISLQVGEITLLPENADDPDNDGTLFTIELKSRIYTLKAPSRKVRASIDTPRKHQAAQPAELIRTRVVLPHRTRRSGWRSSIS